ncbi:MAG: Flp pilus assembly complex ATPase component TadA [Candidatus Omnitrophica bacterium]|nr:Flp pilus assembly complex ATPase component TadA [Candidatus Omnitrophota bacterium]
MALRLGDILLERKAITPEQLKLAISEQQKTGEMLGQVLIKMGLVNEKEMLQVLAEQQGIPFLDLKETKIDEGVIKKVPAKFAWHYKIMPINIDGNVLTVAISDPFDMWPLDDLETNLGYRVEKVLATSHGILEAIKNYYGVGADTIDKILADEPAKTGEEKVEVSEKVEDLEKMAETASVIKLVNQILQEAIKDRATDIHIEHFGNELKLRYRIDGVLYDKQVSGNIRYLSPAIVSRIKVMSGLDIVERRLPQDGRAKVKIGQDEYELRISTVPTLYGENIVIRILPTVMLFSISGLGMAKNDLELLEALIKKPNGIIFVTGPTGSGKTTTLYACLSRLNTRERKIVTIEDPIEYELKGVSQTQINTKINLTFARMLRSMLRHDPDVMMVGEVRDFETAEITIQTALTGHLVFSTLHTNDAASGITRLLNIGIEAYLIASSVEAFMAQRLVRVVCDKCKESYQISDIVMGQFRDIKAKGAIDKKLTTYRGKGCKACNNTGYKGRTGIYEILPVNEEIRKLISQKSSSDMIKEKAVERGMRTLRQDGWNKILEGITTPEEVMRVTQTE